MKFDLHLHTFRSPDSLTTYAQVIAAVQRRGLDGIAVTDHNTIRGALELAEIAPFPVIIGEEIRTDVGDLIGYFLTKEIPKGLSLRESIARIHEQGGVAVVPHPLDRVRRKSAIGRRALLAVIDQLDGIEGLNGRAVFTADNRRAREVARAYGLATTAGSDAHTPFEIGRVCTQMAPFAGPAEFRANLPRPQRDTQDLLSRTVGLLGKESGAWVSFFSTYAKMARHLGVSQ